MDKYTVDYVNNHKKEILKDSLKKVYDKDDNVLFGSSYTKGKVAYEYIPAELMETGNPYIAFVSISYDGKGNIDLPSDSLLLHYKELPTMFPDNEFEG